MRVKLIALAPANGAQVLSGYPKGIFYKKPLRIIQEKKRLNNILFAGFPAFLQHILPYSSGFYSPSLTIYPFSKISFYPQIIN